MDADDISMPGRLAEQVDVLDHFRNIDFVGTKGEYFSKEPGDMGEYYLVLPCARKERFSDDPAFCSCLPDGSG